MAIDKITTSGLSIENLEIEGTEAAKMPVGTTAQRANVQSGDIRFNSTTALMEYYDGTQWKSIDSPPAVSSISPSNIADSDSDVDIVISGSNFISGGQTVTAIGSDGSIITAGTVTRDSNTQLTANFDGTSFDNAQEPYDIKVENTASGLSITSADLLNVNASPAWTVSSGSLGTIYDSGRTGVSITTGATDSEGASLTYSVSVGSLPAGLSISSSTGTISGTATAVGSDTTSTFTLSVTDGSNTVTRQYSITVAAPIVTSYTSTGSGTFTVPSGVTAVDVLVVGGGGSGGGSGNDSTSGGGGGAGGLIYRPAFPVTPGGSVSYSVGAGAPQPSGGLSGQGQIGTQSTFGSLSALGGGGGRSYSNPGMASIAQGGSGGGGTTNPSHIAGGQGQQPTFASGQDSSVYGFGNPGGESQGYSNPGSPNAGGGGGAGASGDPGAAQGKGGIGKQYDISGSQVYYAGGGNGGGSTEGAVVNQGGGGQAPSAGSVPGGGGAATANRGGGGGGGCTPGASGNHPGGAGGSGIIIVKY